MTLSCSRRAFLSLSAGAGLASGGLLPARAEAVPLPHDSFSFLFITDTHLQPELDAAGGCHAAFARARHRR